ncbi:hypothetical protein R5R35_012232 [Gryllus longicercus]|uniref:Uncharacterized protein n=1 Tax=Gryllus longicercus TaxID=2509291 RepID=A0AAN9Z435_9ORTH
MQGPRGDPEPKIVNVFEVLKEAAAGAAFWNDSSVAACAGDIRRVMDGALARERWALMSKCVRRSVLPTRRPSHAVCGIKFISSAGLS